MATAGELGCRGSGQVPGWRLELGRRQQAWYRAPQIRMDLGPGWIVREEGGRIHRGLPGLEAETKGIKRRKGELAVREGPGFRENRIKAKELLSWRSG